MRRNKKDRDVVAVKDNTSDVIEKATGVLTAVGLFVGIVAEVVNLVNGGKNN